MRVPLLVVVAILLGACSTIIEGRTQQVFVSTNPPGADCGFYRQGLKIATLQNTPGSALVEKTKHDMWIVCVKPGHQQAAYFNHSGVASATVGKLILGGGIGWIVDSATGSDNRYDSPVSITLVPLPEGQADGPVSLPASWEPPAAPASSPAPPPPQAPGPDGAARTN